MQIFKEGFKCCSRERRNHSPLELEYYYGTFKSVCSNCSILVSRDKCENTHLRLWIMYGIWLHKSHTPLGGRRSCFTMNETDHNIIHIRNLRAKTHKISWKNMYFDTLYTNFLCAWLWRSFVLKHLKWEQVYLLYFEYQKLLIVSCPSIKSSGLDFKSIKWSHNSTFH